MATYKILQDIEAEDKLLGPLTLRQFIYAGATALLGFIAFKIASATTIYFAVPFLPFIALFAVLAAPFGHDQPNEVWLIAKVNYFLRPHRRVWDQDGIHELVTITAPKKVEGPVLKNYSPTEAKSRLQELAKTIDTRGWSVKNVNVNLYTQPNYFSDVISPERLVSVEEMPKEVPSIDIRPEDDIFETSNPKSRSINQIITSSTKAQRSHAEDLVIGKAKPTNPVGSMFLGKKKSTITKFMPPSRTTVLSSYTSSKNKLPKSPSTSVTGQNVNAILNLARDNNKSIATLEHEGREQLLGDDSSGEVVISLH
jgi:hypothetical protein